MTRTRLNSDQILDGTIVDADVAAGAAIALSKLASISTSTILGNNGATGAPLALTVGQTLTLLGLDTASSPTFTALTLTGSTGVVTAGAFISNAALADWPTVNAGHVRMFRTGSTGTAYPFLTAGNLVLQTRDTGATRDIIFAVGNPSVVAGVVAGNTRWGVNTSAPNSQFHVNGSVAWARVTKTANFTATIAENNIDVSATGGAVTITLPTAVGIDGRMYTVTKTDPTANQVTVATTSSQTINGELTRVIASRWTSIVMQSDNANWHVV